MSPHPTDILQAMAESPARRTAALLFALAVSPLNRDGKSDRTETDRKETK
jgi:hypothetical protein